MTASTTRLFAKTAALAASVGELQGQISAGVVDFDFIQSIEHQLNHMPRLADRAVSNRSDLDKTGTALWNTCVDTMKTQSTEHVLDVLTVAAEKLDALQSSTPSIDQIELDSISTGYYMNRAHLAWLEDHPDLADHFFSQAPLSAQITNRWVVVEKCLTIGLAALDKVQYNEAIKWLEAGIEQIQLSGEEECLRDTNLELHIRYALTWIYMKANTGVTTEQLANQMNLLKTNHGDIVGVKVLELEFILHSSRDIDTTKFFEVLKKVIESMAWTRDSYHLIISYLHNSKDMSYYLNFEMHQLLMTHLPPNFEWIEGTFLHLASMARNSRVGLIIHVRKPRLTKSFRKYAANSLECNDINLTRAILDQIVAENDVRQNLQIVLLLVKLAMHEGKDATQIISRPAEAPIARWVTFLRACIGEAQHMKNSNVVHHCLHKLITELHSQDLDGAESWPNQEYLWILQVIDDERRKGQFVVEIAITVLQSALISIKKPPDYCAGGTTKYEVKLLFCESLKLTYHVLKTDQLENAKKLRYITEQAFQFAEICSESILGKIEESFPKTGWDYDMELYLEVLGHLFSLHSQTDPGTKSSLSKKIRAAIASFNPDNMEAHMSRIIWAIDFEAAVMLRQWDSLESIVRKNTYSMNMELLKHYLSCMFTPSVPPSHKMSTVKSILYCINERSNTISTEIQDLLPGYLRYIFALSLEAATDTDPVTFCDSSEIYFEIAESVIDQVVVLASANAFLSTYPYHETPVESEPATGTSPYSDCGQHAYPPEELQYLAARSFNQAMDFYSAEQDEKCRSWAGIAMNFAGLMANAEGDSLTAQFRERMDRLF
ncbi:hypothetical protein N7462_011107 [Penicillium macrosclerotiorum]|uniref:uncharacterized protein n=1 Tax=Penicillium macrosclerotiorum TaxID=303699 RepID=UPI0025492D6C|nr:uncharacterized protein N7462_011107 [Penicillium macrosclerotiorum]KAJ5666698.1 hypothetical protein N7462_011107 [Penicillium macrosclerotiorum]